MIINPFDNPPAITRQCFRKKCEYYMCGKLGCLSDKLRNSLNGGEGIAACKPYHQRSEGKRQAVKSQLVRKDFENA